MIHRFYGDICALFAALYSLHPYRSARRAIPLSTNIGWTWNAGPSVIWQACAAESKSFIYSSGRFHLCQIQLFCLRSSTNYIWMYLIMGSHDFFNIMRPYYALCPDLNSRINIYTHPHPCFASGHNELKIRHMHGAVAHQLRPPICQIRYSHV